MFFERAFTFWRGRLLVLIAVGFFFLSRVAFDF